MDRKYLNFLGELCVLNNVKRKTSLKLAGVEVPVMRNMPNDPNIDFKFLNTTNSTHFMAKIVNIQLNEMESLSDERVNNLLHQKIQGKLNRAGIRENSNLD